MNTIFTSAVRFCLSPHHVRLGLAVLSLVGMVLGGSAAAYWD